MLGLLEGESRLREFLTRGRDKRLRIDRCEQHDHAARFGTIAVARNRGSLLPLDDIVWRVEGSVDPAAPWMSAAIGDRRERELEGLPVRVDDGVEGHAV